MSTFDRPVAGANRSVQPGRALAITFRVVLRQLTSRGRIIALTLLALVSTIAGFALGQGDADRVVLADPDGNEFCVLTPRDRSGPST